MEECVRQHNGAHSVPESNMTFFFFEKFCLVRLGRRITKVFQNTHNETLFFKKYDSVKPK